MIQSRLGMNTLSGAFGAGAVGVIKTAVDESPLTLSFIEDAR